MIAKRNRQHAVLSSLNPFIVYLHAKGTQTKNHVQAAICPDRIARSEDMMVQRLPSLVLCLPRRFLLRGLLALFSAAVRLGRLTLALPLEDALRRNLFIQCEHAGHQHRAQVKKRVIFRVCGREGGREGGDVGEMLGRTNSGLKRAASLFAHNTYRAVPSKNAAREVVANRNDGRDCVLTPVLSSPWLTHGSSSLLLGLCLSYPRSRLLLLPSFRLSLCPCDPESVQRQEKNT